MTISVYMWTSLLVHTGNEKMTSEEENAIQQTLRVFEIGREPGKSPAGFLVWTFNGIREDTRLQMMVALRNYPVLEKAIKEKRYSFHWDGAETRIYEARAWNEHIQ
jgi:hypothetical protein